MLSCLHSHSVSFIWGKISFTFTSIKLQLYAYKKASIWVQLVKKSSPHVFSRFVQNEKCSTLGLQNINRQRGKKMIVWSLSGLSEFLLTHNTVPFTAWDDGYREANPILWSSSASLQLDFLTLCNQFVVTWVVPPSLQPTVMNEWARLVEGHGDLGCQSRFGNRSEKCFPACWHLTILGCYTARKEV